MGRTSNPQIRKKYKINQPFFIPDMIPGSTNITDVKTGVTASCAISGTRYGLVNGVVTAFGPNAPPVEDKGLRGCPAFTQLAKYTEDLTNAVWVIESGAKGISRPGGNRLIYSGGSTKTKLLNQAVVVPGGTASKTLTLVARVSATSYPQKFRVNNTHLGVIDNFSNDITINEPTSLYLRVQNSALVGSGSQQIGIAISTDNQPFDINIGMNLAEANFIYPYSPNDTTATISFVSEAATATTGTSFDLDAVTLTNLKKGLRGTAVGAELTNPTNVGTQNIDANNYTSVTGDVYTIVSSGTYCQFSWQDKLTIGKTYEFLPTIIGTPIGSIKEQSTNTVLTHGVPIMVTATGTQIAVARATACNVSLRLSVREVQAQGHLELEFVSNVDSGWLANSTALNIFSCVNSAVGGGLYFWKNSSGILLWRLSDNTNLSELTGVALGNSQIFKISLDWGTHITGQKMRITVNGVKSSVVAFSGSFGAQDLKFFFGNTVHAGWIKNIKLSPRPIW